MSTESDFIEQFTRFLREVTDRHVATDHPVGELTERVTAHLGADCRQLPLMVEPINRAQFVDADIALELLDPQAELLGSSSRASYNEASFVDLLRGENGPLQFGPVAYVSMPTGAQTLRQVVGFGIRLVTVDGQPLAIMQRDMDRAWGIETPELHVLSGSVELNASVLEKIRVLMRQHSVLRNQVLTFDTDMYGASLGKVTFHERPNVRRDELILPPGVLERLRRQVIELGRHSARLRQAGQHLKRGVLLYGPPGTGKTHTIRHLLGQLPDSTVLLLNGNTMSNVREATQIARAMQPGVVVLEDCDLMAEDRSFSDSTDSTLFELLEALDGLDGDADVTFILTTNRPELLERALAQRPGRVDLAVEIGLPDAKARQALFALYGRGQGFSDEVIDECARGSEGVTASFAKELIRRAVLAAAVNGREPDDDDLRTALEELLAGAEALTRSLLASGPQQYDDAFADVDAGEILDDLDVVDSDLLTDQSE